MSVNDYEDLAESLPDSGDVNVQTRATVSPLKRRRSRACKNAGMGISGDCFTSNYRKHSTTKWHSPWALFKLRVVI